MHHTPLWLYITGSLLMYMLIGIKVYLLDLWIGIPIRMFWYRLFHKEALPEHQQFGFIHRRKGSTKLAWASALCVGTSLLMVFNFHTDPVLEIFTFLFDTTFVFLGFLAGPWAEKTIRRKNKVLDSLDAGHQQLLDGTLTKNAREKMEGAFDGTASVLDEVSEHVTGRRPFGTSGEKPTQPVVVPEPVPVAMQPEEDPREALRRFTGRGRKEESQ